MKRKQPTTAKGREARRKARALSVAIGTAGRRGPEPKVTLAVVDRVAQRVGKGLTLEMALALEPTGISEDLFRKALQKDVKLSSHMARGKAEFVDKFIDAIMISDDLQHMKWLVTRRHPDLFGEQLSVKQSGEVKTVNTMDPAIIELARMDWKERNNGGQTGT